MPKLAANLTFLFNEVGFLERFEAAARAGFSGVEYLFPYEYDTARLRERLERHGLVQVLHNLPAGDWAKGDRGIACLPDRVSEFEQGVTRAIEYATALGCNQVNCLAGLLLPGLEPGSARDTLVRNLRGAAARLESAGIRLLIEPLNTRDVPGSFLSRSADAIEIIREVGSRNLFLQYDIYHMQLMEGDLAPTIARLLPHIAHMQLADPPARHEPGTGEINFGFLLDFIDKAGYAGWIGCEYKPAAGTAEGLGWARPYLAPGRG